MSVSSDRGHGRTSYLDWNWRSAADESPDQLYARWREAVAHSLFEALANGSVERRRSQRPAAPGSLPSLRYILINLINVTEECARPNGHADLIREWVDGLVGHDPPG